MQLHSDAGSRSAEDCESDNCTLVFKKLERTGNGICNLKVFLLARREKLSSQ